MTIQEANHVMRIQKAAFPSFYRKSTPEEIKDSTLLMASMFEEVNADIVISAVRAFIKDDEEGYPPSIGQINSIINNRFGHDTDSEVEAWAKVRKAISRSLWDAEKEFNKLDAITRRILLNPTTLKEYAMQPLDSVETVIASNFQRSYRAELAKEKKLNNLNAKEKAALGIRETEAPIALIPESAIKTVDGDYNELTVEEVDAFIKRTFKMASELSENSTFDSADGVERKEDVKREDEPVNDSDFEEKRKKTLEMLVKMKG